MSRTAVSVPKSDRSDFVAAHGSTWSTGASAGRAESGESRFGLLAALAACLAFWVLAWGSVALTVDWLI